MISRMGIALLVLVAGSAAVAGPPEVRFEAGKFQQLALLPRKGPAFSWPATAVFGERWSARERARTVGVIPGTLIRTAKGAAPAKVEVALLDVPGEEHLPALWSHASGEKLGDYQVEQLLAAQKADWYRGAQPGHPASANGAEGAVTFEVDKLYPATAPQAAAWDDWIYTTTLMRSETPIYDKRGEGKRTTPAAEAASQAVKQGGAAALPALRALADDPPDARSSVLGEAAEVADRAGDLDLARRLRALYRPMGGCSMDRRPAEACSAYADLCFRKGELGAFLQLQVQIMGDQFDRIAWSSMGDQRAKTGAERLREAGIDPARFLVGLALRFENGAGDLERPREVGERRLARGVREAGVEDTVSQMLVRLAQDGTLDAFNRVRVARSLAFVKAATAKDKDEAKKAIAPLLALELHPIARRWLQDAVE